MKYLALVLAFIFFLPGLGFTQDLREPGISSSYDAFGVGVGINQMKEENLLPRVHSGFVLTLSYDHRFVGDDYRGVSAAIGYSTVRAEPEGPTKSLNALISASYSYGFALVQSDRLKYFIGPNLKLAYSFGGYPNWDDSHSYWANSLSLGFENIASYELGDNTRLFSTLSIPVVSLSSRPDVLRLYKIDEATFGGVMRVLHSNINTGSWNTVFGIHWSLEYQFPVFQTKSEGLTYSFDFIRMSNNNSLPYFQIIHQIGMRILL
jgi:hypothetical protein